MQYLFHFFLICLIILWYHSNTTIALSNNHKQQPFSSRVINHRDITGNGLDTLDLPSKEKKVSFDVMSKALNGKMILAPLTRGGNLPFRRLCADFGMETSISEMIYARSLLRGDKVEKARLRRAPNEQTYGVQIATNGVEEGCHAIREAEKAGADFVDLNCGCPIFEATRRGLGSSLLRSPEKLGRLVKGLVDGSNIPVTVKIRLGCEVGSINCSQVARALREAGAVAITIHGRTAQQGYSKPADWDLIERVVNEGKEDERYDVPVIGNGDILTHYEARRLMEGSGVDSCMVGRGALIKPWIFKEFNENQSWLPDLQERITIYRTLAIYMKEHFGDDEMGRKKSWNFLPWHFEFFARYIPYPEETYNDKVKKGPLIQNRVTYPDNMSPLELLMSNRCKDSHNLIAAALWESYSDTDAINRLNIIAEGHEFQKILLLGNDISAEDVVLTNLPKGKAGKWEKRRGRNPGPKRTEDEITAIRANRAEKKAKILAEGGVWPPS